MNTHAFKDYAQETHERKRRSRNIYLTKLKNSKAVLPSHFYKMKKGTQVLFLEKNGISRKFENRVITIQQKVHVLKHYLKDLYKNSEIELIKSTLQRLIQINQNELWAYGVFEIPSFTVNWGVIKDNDEEKHIQLFDFGELVDDINEVQKYFENNPISSFWVVRDSKNKNSLINLCDSAIATWFEKLLKEEYNFTKVQEYWGIRLK